MCVCVCVQLNLGNMYYTGTGVEKDVAKAKELFRSAAEQDEACENYLRAVEEEEKNLEDTKKQS